MRVARIRDIIIRRLPPGTDLLEELNKLALEEKVNLGQVFGIGALTRAKVGFFDPDQGNYRTQTIERQLEICSLTGNISLKDGKPFVHAHIVLSDEEGRTFGGHLLPGNLVFVAEIIVWRFGGTPLGRQPQPDLGGLYLWPLAKN